MNELDVAIASTLSGGTALTGLLANGSASVFNMSAGTATLPYIVFNQQAGGQLNVTQRDRAEYTYQFQCYTKQNIAAAWALVAQVDALLKGITLSVSGWTNTTTFRETDLPIEETLGNGETVYSVRAFYRFRLSK